ncbi:MAG: response regulator [Rhodoferax sp.]|nr:response regulator [Pseudorhodobacter sp.]
MLTGSLVLVAEDQIFIALDLALAVEDAGGEVAGPVASVKNALALIETRPITAAILDSNLTDGDITPVATRLLEASIPIIIQSGVGIPPELALRFPDLVVFIKPYVAADLVSKLEVLIAAK